jgi:hypothetical protein
MTPDKIHSFDSRSQPNKHFGSHLRKQLERRHPKGTALRETLDNLSDADLIEVFFRNERQGQEHVAKRRAEHEATS